MIYLNVCAPGDPGDSGSQNEIARFGGISFANSFPNRDDASMSLKGSYVGMSNIGRLMRQNTHPGSRIDI